MAKIKWDKNLIYETIELAEKAHAGQTTKAKRNLKVALQDAINNY